MLHGLGRTYYGKQDNMLLEMTEHTAGQGTYMLDMRDDIAGHERIYCWTWENILLDIEEHIAGQGEHITGHERTF